MKVAGIIMKPKLKKRLKNVIIAKETKAKEKKRKKEKSARGPRKLKRCQ